VTARSRRGTTAPAVATAVVMLLSSSASYGADPSPPTGLDTQSLGLEGSHGIAPPVPPTVDAVSAALYCRSMEVNARGYARWSSSWMGIRGGCCGRGRDRSDHHSDRRGLPVEARQGAQSDYPGRGGHPRLHRQWPVHPSEGPRHAGGPGELGSESAVSRRRGRRLQRRVGGLEHRKVGSESASHVRGHEQAGEPSQNRSNFASLTPRSDRYGVNPLTRTERRAALAQRSARICGRCRLTDLVRRVARDPDDLVSVVQVTTKASVGGLGAGPGLLGPTTGVGAFKPADEGTTNRALGSAGTPCGAALAVTP
jgi:hypothetical protein